MNGWIIFITCFIAFIAIGFLIDRLIVTYYTWSERKREEVKRIDEIVALVKWEKEKMESEHCPHCYWDGRGIGYPTNNYLHRCDNIECGRYF